MEIKFASFVTSAKLTTRAEINRKFTTRRSCEISFNCIIKFILHMNQTFNSINNDISCRCSRLIHSEPEKAEIKQNEMKSRKDEVSIKQRAERPRRVGQGEWAWKVYFYSTLKITKQTPAIINLLGLGVLYWKWHTFELECDERIN